MWQEFVRCAHYIYMPITFIGLVVAPNYWTLMCGFRIYVNNILWVF